MRKVAKYTLLLTVAVFVFFLSVSLVSCGDSFDGTIEAFLKSDNYTIESEAYTLKVANASVYLSMGDSEAYLYYSKEEKSYFYCTVSKVDGSVQKLAIDSEEYMYYRTSVASPAGSVASRLSGFMQVKKELTENNGEYTFTGEGGVMYTVSVTGSDIFYKSDSEGDANDYSYKITGVGTTVVEIPEAVTSAVAVEN